MNSIDIYKGISFDKIPWNKEIPPTILSDTIQKISIPPANLLILGCGLGKYAAHFAAKGYQITGIDSSEIAVQHAKQLFMEKKLQGNFFELDLCKLIALPKYAYDLAYDFEVLHHIFPSNRDTYMKNVYDLIKPKAYYLSICFSEKDKNFGGDGKFRDTPLGTKLYFSSVDEIQQLMSNYFTILELKEVELDGDPIPHQAIFCLMQKL